MVNLSNEIRGAKSTDDKSQTTVRISGTIWDMDESRVGFWGLGSGLYWEDPPKRFFFFFTFLLCESVVELNF